MESSKRLDTINEKNKFVEKKKPESKSGSVLEKKRIPTAKDGIQPKEKCSKVSMIPVPKGEKVEPKAKPKSVHQKQRKSYSSSKLCCGISKPDTSKEEVEIKLKLLEEKEKSIALYYRKIEKLIQSLSATEAKEKTRLVINQSQRGSPARKIISEPLVFSQSSLKNDILSDFENSVNQISEIWQKTSTDLSSTLNNLKINHTLSPKEVELEKLKIQQAIKQTKSLTLMKTRNIIAEAKKLFHNREMIRSELEKLLAHESHRLKCRGCGRATEELKKRQQEAITSASRESVVKQRDGGTGDSPKESDFESEETSSNYNNEKDKEEKQAENLSCVCSTVTEESSEEKEKIPAEESDKACKRDEPSNASTCDSTEIWARELNKKNETITSLNNRIFELQKMCNEQSIQYNQLQFELSMFREKIQWNQVLWKQIGKLKEQIKGLQQSNKQLEVQKRDLESKISRLDQELDRLLKLNDLHNQRKYLMEEASERDSRRIEDMKKVSGFRHEEELEIDVGVDGKILAEKQNAINQLKTMLEVMREQMTFAQKQASVFQNKIEELEKNTQA